MSKPEVPDELWEYADTLVEEIIAGYRAKIAGDGLTRTEQAELLNVAIGYHENGKKYRKFHHLIDGPMEGGGR